MRNSKRRAFPGPLDQICPTCAAHLPRVIADAVSGRGLTALEYFAARAPQQPLWDLEVKMPTPEPVPVFVDKEGNTVPACYSPYDDPVNVQELIGYRKLKDIQRLAQWPWEWARQVLNAQPND